MSALRSELKAAGAFESRELLQWARLSLWLGCIGGATFVQATAENLGLVVAMIAIQALFLVPATMHGHDAGHRALSKNVTRNNLMFYLCYPLLWGVSATRWNTQHNVKHHPSPNIESEDFVDPDILLTPFVTTQAQHEASTPRQQWFQRNIQAYVFWPATMGLALRMQQRGRSELVERIQAGGFTKSIVADMILMVAHYALFIGLPSVFFGVLPVLAIYVAVFGLLGLGLALVLIPGHIGLPILNRGEDYFTKQLVGTRNFTPPPGFGWAFVGLQHQVEHHLFPSMPYSNTKIAGPIVQRWAESRGLPYHSMSWFRCVADATRFLHNAWQTPTVDYDELDSEPTAQGATVSSPAVLVETASAS